MKEEGSRAANRMEGMSDGVLVSWSGDGVSLGGDGAFEGIRRGARCGFDMFVAPDELGLARQVVWMGVVVGCWGKQGAGVWHLNSRLLVGGGVHGARRELANSGWMFFGSGGNADRGKIGRVNIVWTREWSCR